MKIRIERYLKTEYSRTEELFKILILKDGDWVVPDRTVFGKYNIKELPSYEKAMELLEDVIKWEQSDKQTIVFECDSEEFLKDLKRSRDEFKRFKTFS